MGTAIIPIYNNETVSDAMTVRTVTINPSQVRIDWGQFSPPIPNFGSLAFTLPAGFEAAYVYQYDLHGHTSGATNGMLPTLASTIFSTDETETPLASSVPTNVFGGTDWWYGSPNEEQHPKFDVGTMNNKPNKVEYNYINTSQVTQATWNIYVTVGVAAPAGGGGGGGGGGEGLSGATIAIIVAVIIFVLIILYALISYFEDQTHRHQGMMVITITTSIVE